MSCPYFNQCSDETIKCKTCMHGDRSYYVEYHEYPSSRSIKWPYLPSGDDLRFQTSTIAEDGLEVWDEISSQVKIFKFSARA